VKLVPAPATALPSELPVRRSGRRVHLGTIIAVGALLVVTPVASVLIAGPAAASGPPPTVTGVSPVSGTQTSPAQVTVTGTNLTGATAVDFGVVAVTTGISVNGNGSSLTVTPPNNPNAPAGTTFGSTFDVTVTTPNGTSATNKNDLYTYEYDSHTCGVSPFTSSCAATISAQETSPTMGGVVTGTAGGTDLLQVPVGATVTLTPNDPGTPSGANFSLSTLDVSTNPPTIENNMHAMTTYATTVTSAVPYEGRFVAEADHCPTQPSFPSAPTVGCPLTPTGGNSDPVIVEWGAPTVTSVSPSAGPLGGGTSVTVNGTNLTGATAVNFGPSAGSSVVVNGGGTSLTVTSPAESTGTVDITVVTPGGVSATSVADQFTYTTGPTVSAVSPNEGPTSGGTSVTVTGSSLAGASAVNFGGTPGTNVVVNGGGTSLTVTSPAESAGTVDITVTTPGGTSSTSAADQFTFVPAPTVTAVSPTTGPTSGGTSVTVTGTNLGGATAVSFGPNPGNNIAVNGAGTSLTVTSPAGSAGTVDVTVTTPGGASATSAADHFTYQGGYWMVGNDGGVFSFDAPFEGSVPSLNIHVTNIVSLVPTSDGKGYWMIGSDGGVFAFGDAGFVGSLPGINVHVNDIVGAVPTSDGKGYWMIGSDGGVFAFGDAGFVGSLPGINVHVNNIVGAVPTASGRGYWMVGTDGGVFAFGNAGFLGSIPGLGIHVSNIRGVVATFDNGGYWMVGTDGGVFAFGDAGFVGSVPGLGIHVNNIVGFARQ
jgi:hypothetical protein